MKKLFIVLMVLILSFSIVACGNDSSKGDDVAQEVTESTEPPVPEYVSKYESITSDEEYGSNGYPYCASLAAQTFIVGGQHCMDEGYLLGYGGTVNTIEDFTTIGMENDAWGYYADWLYDCEITPVGIYDDYGMSWDPENYVLDYSIGELNEKDKTFMGRVYLQLQINEDAEYPVARVVDLPITDTVCFEYKMVYADDSSYRIESIEYISDDNECN